MAHKTIAECVTDVSYHILTSPVICYWTDAWQHGIYLFYIIKKQTTTNKPFLTSKSFNIAWEPAFAHFDKHKKAIWHNLLTIQHEAISLVVMRSKRIVNGLRKLCYCQHGLSSATLEVKMSSKSRIELQHLQILKKMLKSQVSFCH